MAKKLDIAVNSAIPLGIQRHSLPGIPSGTVLYIIFSKVKSAPAVLRV
jgi:hypothetical protein